MHKYRHMLGSFPGHYWCTCLEVCSFCLGLPIELPCLPWRVFNAFPHLSFRTASSALVSISHLQLLYSSPDCSRRDGPALEGADPSPFQREMGEEQALPQLPGSEGPGGLVIRVSRMGEEKEEGKEGGLDWEESRTKLLTDV